MGIFQNIKYQYKLKSLKEMFKESNYKDLNSNFKNFCKEDIESGLKLLRVYMQDILKITAEQRILNDNIILINSFNPNDSKVVTNFLEYYLKKTNQKNYLISTYKDQQFKIFEKLKKNDRYEEIDFFENSIFYQALLTFLDDIEMKILENNAAFFSSPTNLNFTNTRLTRCYFLIVEHPYKTYEFYKQILKSKDLAMNEFLNLDTLPLVAKKNKMEFSMPRKSWGVFHNSWSDPNVLNTLRGAIIKKETLYDDPVDFYASVILHLRQSNYLIPVDYKIIDEYVSLASASTNMNLLADSISNKERKMINRDVENISEQLSYYLN